MMVWRSGGVMEWRGGDVGDEEMEGPGHVI